MADMPQFRLGTGEVVQAQSVEQAGQLREFGIHEITPDEQRHEALAQEYSSWLYAPEAFAAGAVEGTIPGAQAAVLGGLAVISPETAQTVGQHLEGVEAAFPKAHAAGFGTGLIGSILLPGGALAKGAGLAKVAAQGALQSAAMTADDLALKHIHTPEGSEKVGAILGTSALFGAIGGVAISKVFEGIIGSAGAAIEEKGATQLAQLAEGPVSKGPISDAARMMSSMGRWGAAASALNANPAGVASGAAVWAGGKVLQNLAGGPAIPNTFKGLGKALQAFDVAVIQTVVRGLGGKGTEKLGATAGARIADKVYGLSDYTPLSASANWMAQNPTTVVPRIAEHLEKAGVPGPVIDSAIPQTIRAAQYLDSQVPQNPWIGTTVAPQVWEPSLREKAAFLDKVNAVHAPLQALQFPTPAKLEAVKAVYPVLFQRLVSIVSAEAQTNPRMTLPARKWAAAITGLPAGPLDNPESRSRFMQLDAQSAQASQGGKPKQLPGRPSNIIDTFQTRLDRMSE